MQEDEDERENKHPMEMTSDELLDFVVAPEVAAKLRERVHPEPPDDADSQND